jgi:hypothetical protein
MFWGDCILRLLDEATGCAESRYLSRGHLNRRTKKAQRLLLISMESRPCTTFWDELGRHRTIRRPNQKFWRFLQVILQHIFTTWEENGFVVNRLIRDQEVASSNLVTPIRITPDLSGVFVLFGWARMKSKVIFVPILAADRQRGLLCEQIREHCPR